MSTRVLPRPALSASLVRRRPQLLLSAPSASLRRPVVAASEPAGGWADDLRFFATCYAAGVVFFLIMLS